MSRCLITGAAGLIGRHLTNHLLSEGHFVICCDNLRNGEWHESWLNHDQVRLHVMDLTDPSWAFTIAYLGPEVIFHLACAPYEGLSQFCPQDVTTSTVNATINVVTGAVNSGTVKRLVNFSSMSRFGSGRLRTAHVHGPPFTEAFHDTAPEDVYGAAKVCAERIVEILCDLHRIEWCHAVPHNVYGEASAPALADPYRGVILIMVNRLLRGLPILIFGDGTQRRAPSYVGDCVGPLARMGFETGANREVINIGAAKHYSINEIADVVACMFQEVTGRPLPGTHQYETPRPCEVKNAFCSVEKSMRILGYQDRTSLEEGVRKVVEWAVTIAPPGLEPRYLKEFEIARKAPHAWSQKRM